MGRSEGYIGLAPPSRLSNPRSHTLQVLTSFLTLSQQLGLCSKNSPNYVWVLRTANPTAQPCATPCMRIYLYIYYTSLISASPLIPTRLHRQYLRSVRFEDRLKELKKELKEKEDLLSTYHCHGFGLCAECKEPYDGSCDGWRYHNKHGYCSICYQCGEDEPIDEVYKFFWLPFASTNYLALRTPCAPTISPRRPHPATHPAYTHSLLPSTLPPPSRNRFWATLRVIGKTTILFFPPPHSHSARLPCRVLRPPSLCFPLPCPLPHGTGFGLRYG